MTQIELTHNLPDLLELAVDCGDEAMQQPYYIAKWEHTHKPSEVGNLILLTINLAGAVVSLKLNKQRHRHLIFIGPDCPKNPHTRKIQAIEKFCNHNWFMAALHLDATEVQALRFHKLMESVVFKHNRFIDNYGFIRFLREMRAALPQIKSAWDIALDETIEIN